MQNRLIISILTAFILIDALLIYLVLTISPIRLKRESFVYQYGEEIPVDVAEYVNANPSVLQNVKLDLSSVSKEVGTYPATIEYFGKKQSFQIQVVDTIKPKVQLKQVQFNIEVGQTIKAKDLIKKIDDQSKTTVYLYDEETQKKSKSKTFYTEKSYIEKIIVEDAHGNQSAALRVKIVVEANKVLPIISGVKDEEIQIGEVLDLKKGVKAIDDIEGDITSRMIISGEVNNQVPGVYQIVYTVSDKDGNIGKAVRKVTVLENDDN